MAVSEEHMNKVVALPPMVQQWLDGLVAMQNPLAPSNVEQELIRSVESECFGILAEFGSATMEEWACEISGAPLCGKPPRAGIDWPGRGDVLVQTRYWESEQEWKTPSGLVRFRWEAGSPRPVNPEERLIFHQMFRQDTSLVVELKPDRRGSGMRQSEANRATVKAVLEAMRGSALFDVLNAKRPTKTAPNRTALEVELTRFTTRRPRHLFLRPYLADRLWNPIRQGSERFIARASSRENAAKRWECVQKLQDAVAPLISALIAQERALLVRWDTVPAIEGEHLLVSLSRLPPDLREAVLDVPEQQRVWQALYGSGDLNLAGCVVDTSLLPRALAKAIEQADLGEQTGLLIHGEASRAMRYLANRTAIRFQCCYADPPYNTGGDLFPYVDGMPHASWLCLMEQTLAEIRRVCLEGVVMLSIGEQEVARLQLLMAETFGADNGFGPIIVQVNKGGRDYLPVANTHEYLLGFGVGASPSVFELPKHDHVFRFEDEQGGWDERELRNRNPKFHSKNRPNLYYPFYVNSDRPDENGHCEVSLVQQTGWIEVWPQNAKRMPSVWRWGKPKVAAALTRGEASRSQIVARRTRNGRYNIYEKLRKTTVKAKSIWDDSAVRTEQGSIDLRNLFGGAPFPHPKPRALVERCVQLGSEEKDWVLDCFGGTGTTADACLSLERQGLGLRRSVLIEQGEHFDRVLKARVAKAAYSGSWSNGRPVTTDPVSVCFRVIVLSNWLDED